MAPGNTDDTMIGSVDVNGEPEETVVWEIRNVIVRNLTHELRRFSRDQLITTFIAFSASVMSTHSWQPVHSFGWNND